MCTAGASGLSLTHARELILGGQKSGKSRAAESRAACWLATEGREAVLIATARPCDAEMAARIARHRDDRRSRASGLRTEEHDAGLAEVLCERSRPERLLVVDCLTVWLTQLMLPFDGPPASAHAVRAAVGSLVSAVANAQGPLILVSNEIGLGVSPQSADARRFLDELGALHQAIAAVCDWVTLMVAGCEVAVRRSAR